MHEMPVDIEKVRPVGGRRDDMPLPDFLVKGLFHKGAIISKFIGPVRIGINVPGKPPDILLGDFF